MVSLTRCLTAAAFAYATASAPIERTLIPARGGACGRMKGHARFIRVASLDPASEGAQTIRR